MLLLIPIEEEHPSACPGVREEFCCRHPPRSESNVRRILPATCSWMAIHLGMTQVSAVSLSSPAVHVHTFI